MRLFRPRPFGLVAGAILTSSLAFAAMAAPIGRKNGDNPQICYDPAHKADFAANLARFEALHVRSAAATTDHTPSFPPSRR